jgi:hypothetical protein
MNPSARLSFSRIQLHIFNGRPVSNLNRQPFPPREIVSEMKKEIQLLAVELDGKDGLVVTFSDGTTGGYVVEELLGLRPIRERVKIKKIKNALK